jgi:fructokinase
MHQKPLFVGLGELLWDVYPDGRRLGGAPANAALHARNLGAEGMIVSAVGVDADGDSIVAAVRDRGLSARGIQRFGSRPTGTVRVTLDAGGVPSFACSTDTAFDYILWEETLEAAAAEADVVLFGTLAQRNPVSAGSIQRFLDHAVNAVRVFDVNFRGWTDRVRDAVRLSLPKTELLKMNEDEIAVLKQAFGREAMDDASMLGWLVHEFGLKWAALSLGGRGCRIADKNDCILERGLAVDVKDTTGCGDAFSAALALGLLAGDPIREAAVAANRAAAFTATQMGAAPVYSPEQIKDFSGKLKGGSGAASHPGEGGG